MDTKASIEGGSYTRTNARLSICRIDCCTFIIEIDGCLAVFDPWLNDPAKFAPLWGSYHKEALVIRELPAPDVLFISQNAPDHCDFKAISALPRSTPVVAPADASARLKKMGFPVETMGAYDSRPVGSLKVTVIPCEHPGVLKQNGYLLEGKTSSVLVLADPEATTMLLNALDSLGKVPDALLIASTGFTLRHFGQIVMQPEEAADIAAKVMAPHVFPTRTLMHEGVWGLFGKVLVKSFVMPEESYQRFEARLKEKAPTLSLHRLDRGQIWRLK